VIARSDAPERESGPRGATGTQTVPPGASCSPSLGESALRARVGEFRTGHDVDVHTVQFSPDGTLLAAGIAEGVVRIWKVAAREPLDHPPFGQIGAVHAVAFSHDGTRLAVAGTDLMVRLWNPATGQSAGNLPTCCDGPLRAVAFSSDGTLLTSAGDDGVVHRWDLRVNGA
jgi:WD40 repeat protein